MFTEIINRSASFHYQLMETYTAGLELTGSEVKSIRAGKANLSDAYCYFTVKRVPKAAGKGKKQIKSTAEDHLRKELYIKQLHISEFSGANQFNHEPLRERKLLLTRQELKKLQGKVKERGYTIVPVRLYLAESGYIKLDIALAKGKNVANKKDSIKEKDAKREMDRELKRR